MGQALGMGRGRSPRHSVDFTSSARGACRRLQPGSAGPLPIRLCGAHPGPPGSGWEEEAGGGQARGRCCRLLVEATEAWTRGVGTVAAGVEGAVGVLFEVPGTYVPSATPRVSQSCPALLEATASCSPVPRDASTQKRGGRFRLPRGRAEQEAC